MRSSTGCWPLPDHLDTATDGEWKGMARRRPPHPWRDLPCGHDDLFEFVHAMLRDDGDSLGETMRASDLAIEVLVARHRLGPLLASRMPGASWSTGLLPTTVELIRAARERQSFVAERCLGLLGIIDAECGMAGLPFLVVKGPAMAVRCYGDIAARGYWDLDVMVRESDRAAMQSLLERIGAFRLSRTPLGASLSARFNHAFDYERDGIKLDLHWCMTRLPGVRCDDEGAFAGAEAIDLAGHGVRVLSFADELHFILVSAFADIQRGYLRLQTFIDAWELLRRMPSDDWAEFFARRDREGTGRICRETLRVLLASLRLGKSVPAIVEAIGGCASPEVARQLLLPSPGGVRGKRWAVSALPVGPARYAAWWCASLPFRVAASHPAWRRRC